MRLGNLAHRPMTQQKAKKATDSMAGLAKKTGLINEKSFASLTDGTVSKQNLKDAAMLVQKYKNSGDIKGILAHSLYLSISNQLTTQSRLETVLEGTKDFFMGQ